MASTSPTGRESAPSSPPARKRVRLKGVPPAAPDFERDGLAYALEQLPAWRANGWVCDDCGPILARELAARQSVLVGTNASVAVVAAPAPAEAAPASQAEEAGGQPEPSRGPALGEFFESPSMKLVALIAALLIFVGMRQIVQWQWAGGLALAVIPLLPLGLTATFFYFGMRTRGERAFGGYAYCVVAIVLAGFSFFSLNRYWLGGSLPAPWTLLLAITSATALTAVTLRRTGDAAFLHLLLPGLAAMLHAATQIGWPSPWLLPRPAWLYGSTMLCMALAYLCAARRVPAGGDQGRLGARTALLLWARLCAGAVVLGVLTSYEGTTASETEAGLLLGLASLLCVLYGHWFAGAGAAYEAAGLASLAGILLLGGAWRLEWYPVGLAAVALCGGALTLARANRQLAAAETAPTAGERAAAYERIAWGMSALAGAAIAGRLFGSLCGVGAAPASTDWALGSLLGVLCCGVYAGLAVTTGRADVLYAAAASAAFAMAVVVNRLTPEAGLLAPHMTAHDLLPFAATTLLLGLWLSSPSRARHLGAMHTAALPLLTLAATAVGAGAFFAACHGIAFGTSPGLWSALIPYGVLSAAGALFLREEERYTLRRCFVWSAVAVSAVSAGLLAGVHSPAAPWTPTLAAGAALVVLGWGWYAVSLAVARRAEDVSTCLQTCAGAAAVAGAALASSGVQGAAGWMTLCFAGALALLVLMGTERENDLPIYASFAIVVLCPARLSGGVFDASARGTVGVLAATLFALFAAIVYGAASWRLRKWEIVWLSAAAIGIAGGGGVFFGGAEPGLARAIGTAAGFGMAVGAAGLVAAAVLGRRPLLAYAAGALGLIGYARLVTLFFAVDRPWLGLAMLPGLLVSVAISHVPVRVGPEVFHRPLERTALAAAYLGLPVLVAACLAPVPPFLYPLATTLFLYALAFGVSAQIGDHVDHPTGVLSTAALVGGWLFGLQIAAHSPHVEQANLLLVASTAACALLYGRVAWKLEQQPPAYGAAIAACCAWVGLMARVVHLPFVLWSIAGLPFLLTLCAAGEALRNVRAGALSAPLRRVAAAAAGPAVLWAIASGVDRGLHTGPALVVGTLAAYGVALAAGAATRRTAHWAAAAAAALTLAYGYGLAAWAGTMPQWGLCFSLSAAVWLAAACALQAADAWKPLSSPLFVLASVCCAAAGLAGLTGVGAVPYALQSLVTCLVVGSVQAGLFLARRRALHVHAAFAGFLPAYCVLLRYVAGFDAGALDLYLLPVGVYLLVLGHLLSRHAHEIEAWMLRWVGLFAMLVPAFSAFYSSYTRGGSALHALLLLLECVGLVSYGIVCRVKACVQAGTVFAFAFVATASFAVVEIWTGLFSVVFGIALLAAVFYVSVHQNELRGWMTRVGDGWRRRR